jgi:hypothetical protein
VIEPEEHNRFRSAVRSTSIGEALREIFRKRYEERSSASTDLIKRLIIVQTEACLTLPTSRGAVWVIGVVGELVIVIIDPIPTLGEYVWISFIKVIGLNTTRVVEIDEPIVVIVNLIATLRSTIADDRESEGTGAGVCVAGIDKQIVNPDRDLIEFELSARSARRASVTAQVIARSVDRSLTLWSDVEHHGVKCLLEICVKHETR